MCNKGENQTIVCDNLELNFKGNIPYDSNYKERKYSFNDNCYIFFHSSGNQMYEVLADLYIDDRRIGELRFAPRKSFFDSDLINFKMDNIHLYSDNFVNYVTYIIEVLHFDLMYINHIDIASDTIKHNIISFTDEYLYKSQYQSNYNIKHKGKITKDSITTDNKGIIHWDKINATKYIKIYNKSQELIDNVKHNKSGYIQYFWEQHGLDYTNNVVERFELTLKAIHSKLIDYKRLNDSNYLASIMKSHCSNFYEFEKTTIDHQKKYIKDVTPIAFNSFNTTKIDKYKYEPTFSLRSEKIVLKSLFIDYLRTKHIASNQYVKMNIEDVPDKLKDYQTISQTIENLLFKYPSLHEFYNSKKDGWIKEFESTDLLFNDITSIKDYVSTVQLNGQLLFEQPIDVYTTNIHYDYYKNRTKEELKSLQDTENRSFIFHNNLLALELKNKHNNTVLQKKINKTAIEKQKYIMKQDIIFKNIDKMAK